MQSDTISCDAVSVSVIVPVLHEAGLINGLIGHLRGLDAPGGLEIIVVDGAPEQDTCGAVADSGVITCAAAAGRATQMNAGARRAAAPWLVFLHADTQLPQNGLVRIAQVLADPRYVGGAFDLAIQPDTAVFRLIARAASLRSRLTRMPFGDQALFIRREYFNAIGGYCEIPLMEDVDLMQRIRRRGDRICILPERVQTSSRRWEREGLLRCTLRNWTLQVLYLAGVRAQRLAKFY